MDKITQEAYFRQRVLKYAAEHGLPGCDSFWTYVNLLCGASILHHSGGLHKIGDSLGLFFESPGFLCLFSLWLLAS